MTDVNAPIVVLERVRPTSATPTASRMPVIKTIAYTMDISARFLAKNLIGQGTIAAADALIDGRYWRRILQGGNARLSVVGRDVFARHPGRAFVIMSNHSSLLDIPALMGAVPGSVRMVTKEELTKVPLWGPALLASGFIPIDRKNREKAIAQLKQARPLLEQGVHVWVSPEGTRSDDGRLGPFKKGGFHTALGLGAPILPAWIEGAHGIIPPRQWVVRHDGDIQVRFGEPIETAGRDKEDLTDLMREVRASILALSGRAAEVDAG